MITVISDSAKVGSIGAHANVGFRPAGTPHAARLKFARWLDVVYWMSSICSAHSVAPARPSPGDAAASV